MKKVSLCLSIALIAMTLQLLAQQQNHFNCGVHAHDGQEIKDVMMYNRVKMKDFVRPRNAVTYVPVRFYLVAKNNGDDRPSHALALRALCILNENYADQEIQFYLKEFVEYNNSTVHSNPGSSSGIGLISNQVTYNAINVFITDQAGDGVAAYYQLPYGPNGNDWIVSGDQYIDDDITLTHEIGHFFTLNHPFYGWEPDGGWDAGLHGNPVTQFFAPDNFTEVELVDGSNCEDAGDGFCDTPADYMFPFPGGCSLGFEVKDANGDVLNPDFNNFMNYANCSDYYFSPEQKDAIENSLFSGARNYIRPNYTPNLNEVEGQPTVITPGQSETIDTYNSVYFEWEGVTGADFYLVEVASPSEEPRRYVLETTSMTLTDLSPDATYLWRVLAFNEYHTCGGYTSQKIFKTGEDQVLDTSDLPTLDEWDVQPNPVSSGSPISVNVESSQGVEATVRLLTITGQLIDTVKDYKFPAGYSTLELNTAGLTDGIYFVTLRTKDGMETRRVSIVD